MGLEVFCIDGEWDVGVGVVDLGEDFKEAVVFFDEFVQFKDTFVEVVSFTAKHCKDVVDERLKVLYSGFKVVGLCGFWVHLGSLRLVG